MARKKPSLRIKTKKNELLLIKTFYDEFGKIIKTHTDIIKK